MRNYDDFKSELFRLRTAFAEKLAKEYGDGLTVYEVATKNRMHPHQAHRFLVFAGVELRNPGNRSKK